MQARTLVLEKFGRPLKPVCFDLPEPAPREVLAKITAAGICGSDLHMWEGKDPRTPLPIILGHEGVGVVVACGDGASDYAGIPLSLGDPIVWERSLTCGKCYFCTRGHEYLCPSRKVYGINISSAEPPHLSGNYADYILLRKGTKIYPVDRNEDPAVIVPATCSGTTAAHAHEAAGIIPGDNVVIFGAGPVAIFQAAFAKKEGAANLIVITNRPGPKADLVAKFGVDEVLLRMKTTDEERRSHILEATGGIGADVIIDTTPDPSVFREALQLLRRGGTYVNSGAAVPLDAIPIEIYRDITNKNITIRGVWASDASHLKMALELTRYSGFPFHELVTHRFKLEEHEKALDVFRKKEGIKIVFTPWC
ncbi:MAG: zinc-binding dehydrogenase [bacterium]